jgi:hypothetical protein
LEALQKHLENLRTGHEEVAKKLQLKARAFGALPREMRDAIFEQLYIQDKPIEVVWSRIGDNTIFTMPKDEALYLSKWHVGPQIASEAATIFYKYNRFAFHSDSGWGYGRTDKDITAKKLEQWLDTDHFASGMTPRGTIRKIDLHLRSTTQYSLHTTSWSNTTSALKIPDHADFESQYDQHRVLHNEFDGRAQLDYLSKVEGLHEIRIITVKEMKFSDQLNRLLSPPIRRIKENGTDVIVEGCIEWNGEKLGERKIFTHLFDEPSSEDYKTFEEITGRGKISNPNDYEDPMLAWWDWAKKEKDFDVYDSETVNPAFVRVWLQEHFEVYTYYQRNKKLLLELDEIKKELVHQDATAKAIRLRYYARVVELANPELATTSTTACRATWNPWG